MNENRNVKTNFETAVNNPNIQVVEITERLRNSDGYWFEALGMAFPPAVIAFFAGVGWGRSFVELGTLALSTNLAAVTFGFSFALAVYLLVLVLHVLTTTNRYYAAKEEGEEETPPDSFIRTGASHPQDRLLTGTMKRRLSTFARLYPNIKTLAINKWEDGKPFTRAEYQELLAYLDTIKAIQKNQQGRRKGWTLTSYGERKLPEWAAGKFDEPPSPETAVS